MNELNLNITLICAIILFCAFVIQFSFLIAVGSYAFYRIALLEKQFQIFTKNPDLPYDKPINRRTEPPLNKTSIQTKKETENEAGNDGSDKDKSKRTMHVSEIKTALPLQRARKKADEEMDKKCRDRGLLKEDINGNGNSE